jgi:uncharacterized protein (TIGR03435 family)
MRLALALLLCAACLAEAQGQGGAQPASPKPQAEAGPKPSFEVATIKRNVSVDASGRGGLLPSGVFRMVNVPVSMMIMIAYRQGPQLYPSQIIGGPDWLKESYDITAKVGSELQGKSQAELLRAQPLLVQSLLEDRFKLKVHRETRDLQRYALVLAKKDGTLGPQLRRSRLDCNVDFTQCSVRASQGQFASGGTQLIALVNFLASAVVQTVVVDRTGLDGRFEMNLEWTPDRTLLPLTGDTPAPPSLDKPSIFVALQEQLGLKLEPERGPVAVVVIDHVERPTED